MSAPTLIISTASEGTVRSLDADLYHSDQQALDQENISATGNLNIGVVIDYDAHSKSNLSGADDIIDASYTSDAMQLDSGPMVAHAEGDSDIASGYYPQNYDTQTAAAFTNPTVRSMDGMRASEPVDNANTLQAEQAPIAPLAAMGGGSSVTSTAGDNNGGSSSTTTVNNVTNITQIPPNTPNTTYNIENNYYAGDTTITNNNTTNNNTTNIDIDVLGDTVTNITDVVVNLGNNAEDIFINLVNNVFGTTNTIVNTLPDILTTVTNTVTHITGDVTTILGDVTDTVGDIINTILDSTGECDITDLIQEVLEAVNTVVGPVTNTVENVLGDVTNIVGGVLGGNATPIGLIEQVVDTVGDITAPVNGLLQDITGTILGNGAGSDLLDLDVLGLLGTGIESSGQDNDLIDIDLGLLGLGNDNEADSDADFIDVDLNLLNGNVLDATVMIDPANAPIVGEVLHNLGIPEITLGTETLQPILDTLPAAPIVNEVTAVVNDVLSGNLDPASLIETVVDTVSTVTAGLAPMLDDVTGAVDGLLGQTGNDLLDTNVLHSLLHIGVESSTHDNDLLDLNLLGNGAGNIGQDNDLIDVDLGTLGIGGHVPAAASDEDFIDLDLNLLSGNTAGGNNGILDATLTVDLANAPVIGQLADSLQIPEITLDTASLTTNDTVYTVIENVTSIIQDVTNISDSGAGDLVTSLLELNALSDSSSSSGGGGLLPVDTGTLLGGLAGIGGAEDHSSTTGSVSAPAAPVIHIPVLPPVIVVPPVVSHGLGGLFGHH